MYIFIYNYVMKGIIIGVETNGCRKNLSRSCGYNKI